jgi:DDB1- and CUL4-associated factor 11
MGYLAHTTKQPILMSAGWLGNFGYAMSESSIIARHEWKGLSKMGYNLADHVEKERLQAQERQANMRQSVMTAQRVLQMPGAYGLLDDDL